MSWRASLVLPTRNRREELRAALQSVRAQSVETELLIFDDASTDGTGEMVRSEFPEARYFRSEQPLGSSVHRNRGMQMAAAPIIFSLDDDAVYTAPDTIERTLAAFSHPRVAAVAMPFVNVRTSPAVLSRAPDEQGIWVGDAFIATAAALRKDVVLACGGYRESWYMYGEETELCLRLLEAGYVTRLGTTAPVHHFHSAKRDVARWNFLGRRNDILFALERVPMPWLLLHLPATTVNGFVVGARAGQVASTVRATAEAYRDGLARWSARAPLSRGAYRLHRRLRKGGPLPLDAIEALLPPLGR